MCIGLVVHGSLLLMVELPWAVEACTLHHMVVNSVCAQARVVNLLLSRLIILTSCSHVMSLPIKRQEIKRRVLEVSLQVATPGAESAVRDCLVLYALLALATSRVDVVRCILAILR